LPLFSEAASRRLGQALSQLTRLVGLHVGGVAVVPPGLGALVRLQTLRCVVCVS